MTISSTQISKPAFHCKMAISGLKPKVVKTKCEVRLGGDARKKGRLEKRTRKSASSFFSAHICPIHICLHVVCTDSNGETQNDESATNDQKLMKGGVENVNI